MSMEVRFVLTQADLWNFTKYGLRRGRLVVLLALIVVLISLLSLLSPVTGSTDSSFFLSLALLFVFLFAVLFFALRAMRLRAARRSSLLGEHVITISPESFRHKTQLSDATISWRMIKAVRQDQHNIYFVVDSNVLMAHVIPKRAFQSAQAAEAFFGWAQSYWMSGQGPVASPGLPQRYPPPDALGSYERWNQ